MVEAFKYITTSPLETSVDYPYVNGASKTTVGTCKYTASKGTGKITGYKSVPYKKATVDGGEETFYVGYMKNALQ